MTDHLLKAYDAELGELRRMLLEMGAVVETMAADAARSLFGADPELGRRTIEKDKAVNALDLEIDRLCIDTLARYQPVAGDLRAVSAAMRMCCDLERVGDEAVNVCEQAAELGIQGLPEDLCGLPQMAQIAQRMLGDAVAAYRGGDTALARRVCDSDKSADASHGDVVRRLSEAAIRGAMPCGPATRLMFVSKYLERIADHASNIAEMVVYLEQGEMIRHGSEHAREP